MTEEVNRKCRPRNKMVKLSTPCADPKRHNAQRQVQTEGLTDGQTDNGMMPKNTQGMIRSNGNTPSTIGYTLTSAIF